MGNLDFLLGRVQYDTESQLAFPLEAQVGLGVGTSFVALIVLVIVFIYRWEVLGQGWSARPPLAVVHRGAARPWYLGTTEGPRCALL